MVLNNQNIISNYIFLVIATMYVSFVGLKEMDIYRVFQIGIDFHNIVFYWTMKNSFWL